MKIIKYSVFILLLSMFACKQESGIKLSGTYTAEITRNSYFGEIMFLYHVKNGKFVKYGPVKLDADKHFEFQLDDTLAGMFAIGPHQQKFMPPVPMDRFYLQAGDEIELEITDDGVQVLNSNNIKVHKHFASWEKLMKSMKTLIGTASDGFEEMDAIMNDVNKHLAEPTSDKAYNDFMKVQTRLDIDNNLIRFILPVKNQVEFNSLPAYFSEIYEDKKYSAKDIYLHDNTQSAIASYSAFLVYSGRIADDGNPYDVNAISYFGNPAIQEKIALSHLLPISQWSGLFDESLALKGLEYDAMKEKTGKYITDPEQIKRLKKYEEEIAIYAPGRLSPDFSFPDKNGKIHKLSDFKGKLVYIDLWATWCRPCLAEMPSMQKLTKDYKGKDIVFISISIDAKKSDWNNFLSNKKTEGLQLYHGSSKEVYEKEFYKFYKYEFIPRFILIDKQGKVVMYEAYLPSDERIRKEINKLL